MRTRFTYGMLVFSLFVVALSSLAMPAAAADESALTFTPEIPIFNLFKDTITITGTSLGDYIRVIFVAFIWVVGILATVMVVYGGIRWVAAAGNAGRIKEARDTVDSAVIGLIIALASVVLLNIINPSLTKFNGLTLKGVEKELLSERASRPQKFGSGTAVTGDYQTIANRVRAHPEWIATIKANATAQVPAERILAILFIESAGIESAESPAGAVGLMQLLPSTAADMGFSSSDLYNGTKNIEAGARYLQNLAAKTCPKKTSKCPDKQPCINGDYQYINAGYNGGITANTCSASCPGQTYSQCVENEGYAETRNYIIKADSAYQWIVKNKFFGT